MLTVKELAEDPLISEVAKTPDYILPLLPTLDRCIILACRKLFADKQAAINNRC